MQHHMPISHSPCRRRSKGPLPFCLLCAGMPGGGAVSLEARCWADRAEPCCGVHVQVARREDQLGRHKGRTPRRPGQSSETPSSDI